MDIVRATQKAATPQEGTMKMFQLTNAESVWRDAETGGYVAEVRGLFDEVRGYHEWIRLGVYGSRMEALRAVAAVRP